MPWTRLRLLTLLCCLLAGGAAAYATTPAHAPASPDSQPPVLHARSAILVEARTGAILFEDHADEVIPPASLTKLMTLHIALDSIAEGLLDPSQQVVPGPDSWARNMPPHSSLMFLGPRQRLSVEQLLQGLVVDSGNDAAVAIADLVAGSVPAFVAEMNRRAIELGYRRMHFEEPAGLSARNTITAREYADFCRRFIILHPEALKSLFSLTQLSYPLPQNLTDGNQEKPVTQFNRNILLGRYEGIDGLKTGFIDESGYNMAATAQRGGMRLISVVLGVPDVGRKSGSALRATDSAALLDYGFENYLTVQPAFDQPAPVRVWKGTTRSVVLQPRATPVVAVRIEQAGRVKAAVIAQRDVIAPVKAGQVLGAVIVALDDREIARIPLVASAMVTRGGVARRAWDSIILFFRRLGGEKIPA